MAWRDRIKEFRRVPVESLRDNTGNWRLHPQHQQEALHGILREVGISAALIAYHSDREGGALTLIDGHLRKGAGGEWPVLILDIQDAEADLLLATLDPLSAMAQANHEALSGLLSQVQTDDAAVQAMLNAMAGTDGAAREDRREVAPTQEQWLVAVICENESAQITTLEALTIQGYQCRASCINIHGLQ